MPISSSIRFLSLSTLTFHSSSSASPACLPSCTKPKRMYYSISFHAALIEYFPDMNSCSLCAVLAAVSFVHFMYEWMHSVENLWIISYFLQYGVRLSEHSRAVAQLNGLFKTFSEVKGRKEGRKESNWGRVRRIKWILISNWLSERYKTWNDCYTWLYFS
jgi:hypothetical protein